MKKLICLLVIIVIFALSGCSDEPNESEVFMQNLYGKNSEITNEYDSNLAAICHNGTFVGTQKDSVVSFKGIPYAKAPVGELRWKEPVPAEADDGVYEARYFGKSPIQTEWPSEVGSYYEKGEDCLTLNIWENANNDSTDKPVMVFIHGGSYGWGATSDPVYDGHNLVAKFDDIILVTVEYRLGMMGFIDFSAVEGGEEYNTSGNLGLLDQVCALQWIQENIAAFGGDPDNVTVFGESAGGGSVSLLPLIDGTEGLFQRIIAESGSVALTYSTDECQNLTQMLLEETGCTNMKELAALSEEELISVNEKLNDYNCFPERDGVVLPVNLYEAYEGGSASHIDMMIGTNADEVRYWINEMGYYVPLLDGEIIYKLGLPIMYETNLKRISDADKQNIDTFMALQNDKKIWNLTEFYNEVLFRVPAIAQAESHSKNGGNTYMYYWTYPGENEMVGACHAIELTYIFNNLDNAIYTGDKVNTALADAAQNMWVNFARTGNPSTEKYAWQPYDADSRMTMVLGNEISIVSDLKGKQRALLEPILNYGFNGCYTNLSFNVPQVYKIVGGIVCILATFVLIIIFLKRTIQKRK